jgi:dolichyl-phosphate-mannose-protein mannosyltransferase
LFLIPLLLSVFTHLWNPLGAAPLVYDEGTYIGRAMHVLKGLGPQADPYYDHPYFGQLFLAGIFKLIGYPDSLLHPVANGDVHSIEMLWLVPRVVMGVLAVVDTFLIYKIAEYQYNRKVGFVASVLFAVMPSTFFLSKVYLDSILMPFLLLSILFAVYLNNSAYKSKKNDNNRIIAGSKTTTTRNLAIIAVLLSGISLGLAIFTKIPAFTIIPLVGYLIFKNTNKNLRLLGLWFVPVILIPAAWPAYALFQGQFGDWLDAIFYQTHRQGELGMTLTTILANKVFKIDPTLLMLGIAGLAFAVIRRDYFVLLWSAPFLVFVSVIGFVRDFHLIPLMPLACIGASRLITELTNKIKYKKVRHTLPYAVISAFAIIGFISFITISTADINNDKFQASALVSEYLTQCSHYTHKCAAADKNSNGDNKITVISQHVYSWIPKYVFHLIDYNYKPPELEANEIPTNNEMVLLVVDSAFKNILSMNDDVGNRLKRIYNSYGGSASISDNGSKSEAKTATRIEIGRDMVIILPTPLRTMPEQQGQTLNLLNTNFIWKPTNHAKIISNSTGKYSDRDHNDEVNRTLNILVKTNSTDKIYNRAILQTQINLSKKPLLLSMDYASKSLKGKAVFYMEIDDKQNTSIPKKNILWATRLDNTHGFPVSKNLLLPNNIANKNLRLIIYIVTDGPGQHFLRLTKANIE